MPKTKNIIILGATGSIGEQTLAVIAAHPNKYKVHSLVAHKNYELLLKLCLLHKPRFAVLTEKVAGDKLKSALKLAGAKTKVYSGMSAMLDLITLPEVDGVMCAMVGAIGIKPVFQAIAHNKIIYLANKESMVVAGELINKSLHKSKSIILPVDSEHNAIFQCLPDNFKTRHSHKSGIKNLWLTASGGPFHQKYADINNHKKINLLKKVQVADALAHPKWNMGAKISIDSATLMNKGLEVIEAHFLFNIKPENIKVVIHPQSIIHSLIEYIDGSFLAQLSTPDMKVPIAYSLAYPHRIAAPQCLKPTNLFALGDLNFSQPNLEVFPCLQLAFNALKIGGNAALVLNAANEISVQAFIDKKIGFMDIPRINEEVMLKLADGKSHKNLESLIENDLEVRGYTQKIIKQKSHKK